jgi:hypothetical protein
VWRNAVREAVPLFGKGGAESARYELEMGVVMFGGAGRETSHTLTYLSDLLGGMSEERFANLARWQPGTCVDAACVGEYRRISGWKCSQYKAVDNISRVVACLEAADITREKQVPVSLLVPMPEGWLQMSPHVDDVRGKLYPAWVLCDSDAVVY